MLRRQSDKEPEARDELFSVAPRISAPVEHHWFVDDARAHGYCAACGLPAPNKRHVKRAA